MNEKNFFNLKDMVIMALFAALTCVLAPLAVPIGPVPISLTNLVIYFSLYVLGWQRATITYIVYLLLGLVGLPVFSGLFFCRKQKHQCRYTGSRVAVYLSTGR